MNGVDYFNLAQVLMVILDSNGRIENLNDRACEILGVSREEAIGLNWFESFVPPESREKVKEVFRKVMSGELNEVGEYENEILTRKGEKRIVRWRNTCIRDLDGRVRGTLSSGLDVTEEVLMKKELEKSVKFYEFLVDLTWNVLRYGWSEEILKKILKKAVEMLPNVHAGSVVTRVGENYRYSAMVGYDFEKLKNVRFPPDKIREFATEPRVVRWRDRMMVNDADEETVKLLKKYGKTNEIEATLIFPITLNGEIEAYMTLDNFESKDAFTETDIKMAKVFQAHMRVLLWKDMLEKSMRYLADHDFLTGVLNRRAFTERLEKNLSLAKRNGRKLSVVYIDMNDFKGINDTYGHDCGDKVLTDFCGRLSCVLRESDDVGRIGGDEFVILLNDADANGARSFISRLKEALETPVTKCGDKRISISISVGYATYPDDGEDVEKLIMIADERMYKDKRRNTR